MAIPNWTKNGELAGPGLIVTINPGPSGPVAKAVAKAQSLSRLVTMLNAQLGVPVLDKTGLDGKYDFNLEFTPNLPPQPNAAASPGQPNDSGPDLPQAMERQLGLRLTPARANLDILIVDNAQRAPSSN
jgi:uncharacterized protein (TIGR03435 family)